MEQLIHQIGLLFDDRLFLCLLIAFTILGLFWGYMRFVAIPDDQIVTAREMWSVSALDTYNLIIEKINSTDDQKELDRLEVEIDTFENHYANLISLDMVQGCVVKMYDRLKVRKEQVCEVAMN